MYPFILVMIFLDLSILAASTSPTEDYRSSKRMRTYYGASVTTGDRVIQEAPTEMIESTVDPILKNVTREFARMDAANEAFTPNLSTFEQEFTPEGTVNLDKVIGRNAYRVVFSLLNRTDVAIIYEHDCVIGRDWSRVVHPLLSRTAYAQAAQDVSIGDVVSFISPPTPLRESYKTSFNMTSGELFSCTWAGATVRYAIVKLLNPRQVFPLTTYLSHIQSEPNQLVNYQRYLRIGAGLVVMIRKLHSYQLVHGNIRLEDIYVHMSPEETVSFRLGDFGNAAWINPVTGAATLNQRTNRIFHHRDELLNMSPWELKNQWGHHYSRMDDLFRVVEIIARLFRISPDQRPAPSEVARLLDYKLTGNLFDSVFMTHVATRISPSVASRLASVEALGREETLIPPYTEILVQLYNAAITLEVIQSQ